MTIALAEADDAGARLAALLAERARRLPHHQDGVYFNLPDEIYRADPALGSTDMRKLAYAPCDYWWGSDMNPKRPVEPDTPAQRRGTAVHVLVFQGEPEFDRRYMRGADNTDDMSPTEKSANTKAVNREAAKLGLIALPAREYDRLAMIAKTVSVNEHLLSCFSGGASEVSVFWTEHLGPRSVPVRKKARLDYLKPRGIGDLKSVANQYEMPFPRACINAITNYNYHVQAKQYLDARARMPALIEKGNVFTWYDGRVVGIDRRGFAHMALLDGVVRERLYAWQWVFWQAERAPITWSRVLSPKNPMLELAGSVIRRAEANYLQYLERYGVSQWVEVDKPLELYLEDMPSYFGRD